MIDGGLEIDIQAILQNIEEADVISLYFPILRQTLLVDTRTSSGEGPYVAVVPMVSNSTERFESLRRLRPRFPRPHSITMIPWARSIGSLQWEGVWDSVMTRLECCGDKATLTTARRTLRQLRSLELVELRQAIVGAQYRTVWGRAGVGDADAR